MVLQGNGVGRDHHAGGVLERKFDCRPAHGIGLVDVGLRCDVARRTLHVVGDAPVKLVAERVLDHTEVGIAQRGALFAPSADAG